MKIFKQYSDLGVNTKVIILCIGALFFFGWYRYLEEWICLLMIYYWPSVRQMVQEEHYERLKSMYWSWVTVLMLFMLVSVDGDHFIVPLWHSIFG
jgi:hypothetical protein